MSENPFISPRDLVHLSNRQIALSSLSRPAFAMLIASFVGFAIWLYRPLRMLYLYHTTGVVITDGPLKEFGEYFFNVENLMLVGSFVAFCAGLQMLKGTHFGVCMMGAVISMIPMISPGYVLGIPIGVWAFVVLLRKDTRVAFAEAK